MKSRPTQFGVREHTASPRQHASRLAADSLPSLSEILPRDSQLRASAPVFAFRPSERPESVTTDPLDAATGGGRESGEEVLSVPATPSATNESRQAFEPLIGSESASQRLENTHAKTFPRYA